MYYHLRTSSLFTNTSGDPLQALVFLMPQVENGIGSFDKVIHPLFF